MFHLPSELVSYIYEFDPTYRIVFNEVLGELLILAEYMADRKERHLFY